jgi:hypothetical protein
VRRFWLTRPRSSDVPLIVARVVAHRASFVKVYSRNDSRVA